MRRTTKGANITTTQRRTIPEGKEIWSGQFHFLINPDCDLEYLQGAEGGYVSAISLADSEELFLKTVFAALKERKVTPDDEYDEIEEISEKYRNGDLSDEWIELCNYALNTGRVAFNTFDVYEGE
jgi:hypothetical protein